jgi:hypothetical protein
MFLQKKLETDHEIWQTTALLASHSFFMVVCWVIQHTLPERHGEVTHLADTRNLVVMWVLFYWCKDLQFHSTSWFVCHFFFPQRFLSTLDCSFLRCRLCSYSHCNSLLACIWYTNDVYGLMSPTLSTEHNYLNSPKVLVNHTKWMVLSNKLKSGCFFNK